MTELLFHGLYREALQQKGKKIGPERQQVKTPSGLGPRLREVANCIGVCVNNKRRIYVHICMFYVYIYMIMIITGITTLNNKIMFNNGNSNSNSNHSKTKNKRKHIHIYLYIYIYCHTPHTYCSGLIYTSDARHASRYAKHGLIVAVHTLLKDGASAPRRYF